MIISPEVIAALANQDIPESHAKKVQNFSKKSHFIFKTSLLFNISNNSSNV